MEYHLCENELPHIYVGVHSHIGGIPHYREGVQHRELCTHMFIAADRLLLCENGLPPKPLYYDTM